MPLSALELGRKAPDRSQTAGSQPCDLHVRCALLPTGVSRGRASMVRSGSAASSVETELVAFDVLHHVQSKVTWSCLTAGMG
jgi:hypothetical protein